VHGQGIDPNVRMRIERGGKITSADYAEMVQARQRLVRAMDVLMADLDALMLPTTALCAPKFAEVSTPETFSAKNMLLLRNPAIVNFFDLCAISIPIGGATDQVGLMLVARNGHDRRLFNVAASVERLFGY